MIKPSSGMMCQGVRKEIQIKGVIGDPIHFDALGAMQEFVKMLISIVTRKSMKLARILNLLNHVILKFKVCCLNCNRGNWSTRPFKFSWHNSFIVRRLGTGGSPFPSVAILKSFKRVGSTQDLLRISSSDAEQREYVPWSSRLLRYAKSRPNGKLIHNSILNGPYVRQMIAEPGDAERDVNVNETFHEQTDDELSERELKQIEADDQAIQTILLCLPEDIYVAVDSCETAQEIWLRVQQMMKGSDIGILEKKAKLFNEWERFTSNEGELIESYYHRFLKLMNDLKKTNTFQRRLPAN
nr:hypothetical protein [Tanacetum cinerariifolium]